MNIFGIIWGTSEYLVWLPVVVIGVALLMYRFSRTKKSIEMLAVSPLSVLLKNASYKKYKVKIVLISVGLLFLFLSLLSPQWHKGEEKIAQQGRELFIALDVSRSMLATDCMPNRLNCAKKKIKLILQKLSCERVGLILFSGSAFVQCPLTSDYAAFYMYLDSVDAELISSGTTAIDKAIQQTLKSFANMPERKNKILVLFTDGEDFSRNLSGVKSEAAQAGLSIFTMGIGTPEGAPVPLFDAFGKHKGHQKDGKGNVVISRLNEGILHALAEDAGGTYLRITETDADINSLVQHVQSFEKERFEDKTVVRMDEQYPYFLLVSFLCFMFEWLI